MLGKAKVVIAVLALASPDGIGGLEPGRAASVDREAICHPWASNHT